MRTVRRPLVVVFCLKRPLVVVFCLKRPLVVVFCLNAPWWSSSAPRRRRKVFETMECYNNGSPGSAAASGSLRRPLQVVALHQASGRQRAAVGEEGGLHVQPSLRERGVAAGGRAHLLGPGEVGLLPLGCGGGAKRRG
ncbi:hypothetical protein EYF80_056019 [Liparis tanakae]|uniref:Uncharacterized protein n=1 Tax=Liparis tanakae TaxID=230148 RepID=A0A4Z2EXX8_9TELE|nr:hypothetical protein EYF80_056019 [Liparis tanakae]